MFLNFGMYKEKSLVKYEKKCFLIFRNSSGTGSRAMCLLAPFFGGPESYGHTVILFTIYQNPYNRFACNCSVRPVTSAKADKSAAFPGRKNFEINFAVFVILINSCLVWKFLCHVSYKRLVIGLCSAPWVGHKRGFFISEITPSPINLHHNKVIEWFSA